MNTIIDTTYIMISDTVKISDTINYYSNPSFWFSLGTWTIALIALLSPPIYNCIKTCRKNRLFAKYLIHLLNSLSEAYKNRIPKVDVLSKEIKNIQPDIIALESNLLHPAQTIVDIDNIYLYNSFINLKKPKHEKDLFFYNSIFDATEYFLQNDDICRFNFGEFKKKREKYISHFNSTLDKVLSLLDKYFSDNLWLKNSKSKDTFIIQCEKILSNWQNDGNIHNYDIIDKKLLIPLNKLCTLNPKDQRATRINNNLIICNDALNKLNNLCKGYGDVFDSIKNSLIKNQEILDAAQEHFKTITVKNCWLPFCFRHK